MTQEEFFRYCLLVAKSIVARSREAYPGCEDAINGMFKDAETNIASESTDEMLTSFNKWLPSLLKTQTDQILPTEKATYDASATYLPKYSELNNLIYSTYGPQYAKTASEISNQIAKDQVASDLGIMTSQEGQGLVKSALDTQKLADPEYYAQRTGISDKLTSLLSGLNPNALSEGERVEVQRGLNQQNQSRGNLTNPSQTAAVEGAMTFGDALNQKKTNVANILSGAAQSLPSLKSGLDTYQIATGKSSNNSNLGDSKFSNVQTPTMGQTAANGSQNLLSSLTGITQSNIAGNAAITNGNTASSSALGRLLTSAGLSAIE